MAQLQLQNAPEGFCKGSVANELGPKSDAAHIGGGALQGGKDGCQAGNRAANTVADTCDAPRCNPSCMIDNAASVGVEQDLGKSGLKKTSRMLCLSGTDVQKSASFLSGVNATGLAEGVWTFVQVEC